MTATDILRRLLDERGVEWEDASPVPSMRPWKTSYTSFTGEEVTISDYDEPKWLMGTLVFFSPEQAIDATLGLGTCEVEGYDDGMDEGMDGEWFAYAPPTWYLSCGHEAYGSERPRYCPNCGRRCVG